MLGRRSFLAGAVGMMAGSTVAQQAIMEGKKAVVCDSEPIKCPLGHDTCRVINAPMAVGNDSYQSPEAVPLPAFHFLRCDTCHVLFTRE
jgi:hypothetical protein